MRELTKSEKELLKKILNFKEKGLIQELQSARLLRKQLSCTVLKWTQTPQRCLTIYYSNNEKISAFYEIVDYLTFIKELEDNRLITILPNTNKDISTERILYDRDNIGCKEDCKSDTFEKLLNTFKEEKYYYQQEGNTMRPLQMKEVLNIDIIDMLERYATAIICPLPLLREFVNNNYITLENVHYKEQRKRFKIANFVAIVAVLIAAIFGIIQSCSDTTLNKDQYREFIKIMDNKQKL